MKAFIGRLTWLAEVGFLHCVASEYGVVELGSTICEPNRTLPSPADITESSAPVCGNIALITWPPRGHVYCQVVSQRKQHLINSLN